MSSHIPALLRFNRTAGLSLLLAAVSPLAFAELADIQKRGVVRLAMSGEYPPFSMPDASGKIVGFDADVATEIARRLGVKAEIVQAPFSSIVAGLQTGSFDIGVASHARTPERERAIAFSKSPYYYSGAQLFVLKKSDYTDLDSLKGAPIAVDQGGTNQQYLQKMKYPKISAFSGIQDELLALNSGRVAAIFTSPIVGNVAIKNGQPLKPIGELLFEENAWVTLAKKQPQLEAAVNKALDDMRKDGTLAKISQKWIGADITKPPKN